MITNNNNRTRGRTLAGLMLQGLVRRNLTEDQPLSTANANTANNQSGTRAGQKPTFYECGAQGHFKRDCPKLKNNNHGNQGGNGKIAPSKSVYEDLMPVELGSFDVIIGMDWLAKYQAVIVCAEKIIRIPWGNETFGCHIFLAHVTTKETEDKSKKKRLEDVPIIQNFLKVFPEDYIENTE
ncbi:putative reverse transcriptase domain-containing protein [Tanacetum coccineum]